VLFVAVLAAHVWAADVIVERLWPKEDMAKTIQPKLPSEARSMPPAADHPPARPGVSAPMAQCAPEAPVSVTDARGSRISVLVRPTHAVTDAARGSGTARSRPATNAERQAAYRARHGDIHRAKEAARKRAARAKQRSAGLCAAEPELSAASLP
jgi:hypothetical protein